MVAHCHDTGEPDMTLLILGLLVFLGVHSLRIVAPTWRDAQRARLGENAWKGLYSVASLVGFVLIAWGYGQARQQPVVLWAPPVATRHLAGIDADRFVMVAASQVEQRHPGKVAAPDAAGRQFR
jgi:uncharacterized membrane protein